MQMLAYTFDRARDFIQIVRGKLPANAWAELTLILSDRTAQRDFSPDPSPGDNASEALEAPLSVLARQFHALAALGGPGTGLVGAGPALAMLHGLGLGSAKDLAQCFTTCGVTAERVEALMSTLRNGGLLVFVNEEEERQLLRERGQELALELPDGVQAAPAPVIAPAATISEQRANYTPVLMPTDVADRNR